MVVPTPIKIGSPPRQLRPTLLIVDDDEGPRETLRMTFEDAYDILVAESGPEALKLVQKTQVATAIVDILMPGMTGLELFDLLRQVDPTVEVIILTGFGALDSARQALRLGACDYLLKPCETATIRAAVARAMERHSLTLELQALRSRFADYEAKAQHQAAQEQRLLARKEIYASIMHDVNSPLSSINFLADIMNQRINDASHLTGPDLQMLRGQLASITQNAHHCVEISRRYINFLGERSSHAHGIEVDEVFARVEEHLRAHPALQSNLLLVRPLGAAVLACINRTDLKQILLNLAHNGLQCTPEPHRVEIAGQLLAEPLQLSDFADTAAQRFVNRDAFKNQAPLIAVSVRDDGPGIPPPVVNQLFQARFTTKPMGRGAGLGLSIVQRLVEEAHGGLHLRTGETGGTTFTVYLPAIHKPA